MKLSLYKVILYLGFIILIGLFTFDDYCYFYWHNDFTQKVGNYNLIIFLFSLIYILTVFTIYTLDLFILIINLLKNKKINTLEFYNYCTAIAIFFIYFELIKLLNNNGKCDFILIPNDTGGFLIIITCILITYWKVKIIINNKNIKSN